MPPPPSAPSAPAAVEDQAPPSMLLPGNFPFPAVDERERENGAHGGEIPVAVAAGPSAPPPTYPALPRGLKPFVDVVPNSDEEYELQYMRLLRMFWRRSAYYFGERDDEYEARARAGDVSRFGDDARESDDESGDDDAQEGDDDDDDAKNGPMIDERWVRKMSKAFKLGDFKITDERLMPREILEAAFGPESGDGGRKRRAVEPDAAHAPAQKKAKGAAAAMARPAQGLSRLERLARLETRAASGEDASGKTNAGGGGKSAASRARAGVASARDGEGSEGDDDDAAGVGADDDDELDSDDDYAKAVDFDDDDGYDDDVGGHDDGDAFY